MNLVGNYNRLELLFESLKISELEPEIFNYKHLLEYKINDARRKFEQISLGSNDRSRRGLINGLGSAWKFITGNLDQTDAEKYDKAIEDLKQYQNKFVSVGNSQISIVEKMLHTFNLSIVKLHHNEEILENRLLSLERKIQNLTSEIFILNEYEVASSTFYHFMVSLDIIINILSETENAISFAHANILHVTLIEHEHLSLELNKIASHLNQVKLPFNPKDDIFSYYAIIRVRGYISKGKVIFILEVPLVENLSYDYYGLYALPISNENSFLIIVPRRKFLILNENYYSFTDNTCKLAKQSSYLCEETKSTIGESNPCEVELLMFPDKQNHCNQIPSSLKTTKIQKLQENYWMLVAVNKTTVTTFCGTNDEKKSIFGTYLVFLPNNCEVRINEHILRNSGKSEIKLKMVNLPNIEIPNTAQTLNNKVPSIPLKLDNLNLNDLKEIETTLEHTKVQLDSIEYPMFHFNNISLYTILIYLMIFVDLIYFIFVKYKMCLSKRKEYPQLRVGDPMKDIELKN